MAYTLDYVFGLGSSNTGLTLRAQIVNTIGVNVGSEIAAGIIELGNGWYLAHITTIPDEHRGGIKFYQSGSPSSPEVSFSINPEEGENLGTIEDSYTLPELLRGMAAVLFGLVSGGGTSTFVFRDLGDTKDRVTVTADTEGNRTVITLDLA